MARARNIKPGFFINEDLVELPFSTRLLFIGLWTIADREGRLDDRPRKIKMAVFPADDIDVEPGLQELHDARMIIRYRTEGKAFIEIINFTKHQSPHVKEPASTIPAPGKSGASTVLATLNDERGMMKDEVLNDDVPAPPVTHRDDPAAWTYPMKDLIDAFPDYLRDRITPSMAGFIEADVKPGDESAWAQTLETYRMNFNPATKSYLPDKTANLLGVFRKFKAEANKQNGTNRQHNGEHRATSTDRLRATRTMLDKYPTEAELRENGGNADRS